jgi:putative membrane protein
MDEGQGTRAARPAASDSRLAPRALAANQGLYNGFLAAGLFWGLWADRRDLKIFFLGCVAVAGVFGGLTAKMSILFTQALPAVVVLGLVVLAPRRPVR